MESGHKRKLYALLAFRILLILLVSATIVAPFVWEGSRPASQFNPANYFSFFTIQSNMLGLIWMIAAVSLQLHLVRGGRDGSGGGTRLENRPRASMARGAILLYLLVTMIVYQSVLRGAAAGPWAAQARDWMLHGVFPLAFLADWLIDPGEPVLPWKSIFYWLSFPFLYASCTLIRGAFAGWYPYFFIDPAKNGYGSLAVGCAALLAGFIALGSLLVFIQRLRKGVYRG